MSKHVCIFAIFIGATGGVLGHDIKASIAPWCSPESSAEMCPKAPSTPEQPTKHMKTKLVSPSKSREASPTKGKCVRFVEIYDSEPDSPAPDLKTLTQEQCIQAALKAIQKLEYKPDGNPVYSLCSAARDYAVCSFFFMICSWADCTVIGHKINTYHTV